MAIMAGMQAERTAGATKLYPSFVSMDPFLDVERLRELDGYIAERLRHRIARESDPLFLNQHRLEPGSAYQPGVREVWLTRTVAGKPYDYMDIDRTDLWEFTEAASEFTLLTDYIRSLPFAAFGRMLLIYDDGGRSVPAHRDHERTDVCHEFIWMRTNPRKPFYMLNEETGERRYVEGHSAWFDSVNQYHGCDGADGLTFSIRVDGRFSDDFRARVPFDETNPASTPAVWAAAIGGQA